MPIIHVLAIITTRPGQRAVLLSLFKANIPTVVAEEGCLAYEATTDSEGAGLMQAAFGPDVL